MRATEFISEDDYYGPADVDNSKSEEELQQFLDLYLEEVLGAPHTVSARRDMGIVVAVPRDKSKPQGQRWAYEGQREDWLETSEDLAEKLDAAGFGRYELTSISAQYIQLDKSNLNETTCAGGIAVGAIGGLGPAITRNASIYGNDKKKKKPKKAAKYKNSKQD